MKHTPLSLQQLNLDRVLRQIGETDVDAFSSPRTGAEEDKHVCVGQGLVSEELGRLTQLEWCLSDLNRGLAYHQH